MTLEPRTIQDTRMMLRVAQRDLKTLQRTHEKVLEQWTRERGELRQRIRAAQRRERMLVTLLTDYLAGYSDTPDITKLLEGKR